MTKYIEINERLYYKNKFVGDHISFNIVEKMPDNTKEKIVWNTLNKISIFTSGYSVWEVKKGRVIYLDINKILPTAIKEWKQKNPNLILYKSYREIVPSLNTIVQFPNAIKSAQYLKDHFNTRMEVCKNDKSTICI